MAIRRVSIQLTEREYMLAKRIAAAHHQSLAGYLRTSATRVIGEQARAYRMTDNLVVSDDPEPVGRFR